MVARLVRASKSLLGAQAHLGNRPGVPSSLLDMRHHTLRKPDHRLKFAFIFCARAPSDAHSLYMLARSNAAGATLSRTASRRSAQYGRSDP